MGSYLTEHTSTRKAAPQNEPMLGREREQVKNAAGGYVFEVDELTTLRRFLILGSEGGTYYASEKEATKKNVEGLKAAIEKLGVAAVNEIAAISEANRAPKNDVAIFALAMAASYGVEEPEDERALSIRHAALDALPRVCRTGTHLFQFVGFMEDFRGWGRAAKRAVARWYTARPVEKVAFQAVKYRARHDWTHRDVLRMAKPGSESGTTPSPTQHALFEWIVSRGRDEGDPIGIADAIVQTQARVGGIDFPGAGQVEAEQLEVVKAFERAQSAESVGVTVKLIEQYGGMLPREALKTDHANKPEVVEAMLHAGVPMMALTRNLANYTRYGVLKPMGDMTALVCRQLTDPEKIRKSRLHPVALLNALLTYKQGFGERNHWTPVGDIVDALDEAVYLAFGNVPDTGKRTLLALDCSGSMVHPVLGMDKLTARAGAALMAMVTHRAESRREVVAFSNPDMNAPFGGYNRFGLGSPRLRRVDGWRAPSGYQAGGTGNNYGTGIVPVELSSRQRVDDVIKETDSLPFGATDCALPMLFALDKEREVDTFVIYTDNETWAGSMHPVQALRKYRAESGIPAKLVVVAMTAASYSIADPRDAGMLDVVGFDTAAPGLLADFSAGRL